MSDPTNSLAPVAIQVHAIVHPGTERPRAIPAAVYLAGVARGSRRTLRQSLDAIAGWASGGVHDALTFPWHALRYEHTAAVRAMLAERYAIRTANKMLSALRGVLKEAWRLELMDADAYQRAADLKNIRGKPEPSGRALESSELRALLAVCAADPSPAGRRDAAAIAMGYGGGHRVTELMATDLRDYRPSGRVVIRAGKGRKAGHVDLTESARKLVADWLEIRSPEPGPLFVPLSKAGRLLRRSQVRQASRNALHAAGLGDVAPEPLARLSARGFGKILNRRRVAAGLEPLSPHDLRRSMITHLLERTGDLALAQRRARHANPQTTAQYDKRQEVQDRHQALQALEDTF